MAVCFDYKDVHWLLAAVDTPDEPGEVYAPNTWSCHASSLYWEQKTPHTAQYVGKE